MARTNLRFVPEQLRPSLVPLPDGLLACCVCLGELGLQLGEVLLVSRGETQLEFLRLVHSVSEGTRAAWAGNRPRVQGTNLKSNSVGVARRSGPALPREVLLVRQAVQAKRVCARLASLDKTKQRTSLIQILVEPI